MNWNEPTDEMREGWEQWLADRPDRVRRAASRFFPWGMYRLVPTGQRCQTLAFAEDGTVRIYAEHETLGPMTGVEVFGVDPNDLVPWVGSKRADWVIEREPAPEDQSGPFRMGDKITFRIEGEEP